MAGQSNAALFSLQFWPIRPEIPSAQFFHLWATGIPKRRLLINLVLLPAVDFKFASGLFPK